MKLKKLLTHTSFCSFLIVGLIMSNLGSISAVETNDPFETVEPPQMIINNVLINGVIQYKDPVLAKEIIYNKYKEEINKLVKDYELGELSKDTYDSYKSVLFGYGSSDFRNEFLTFVDTYENTDYNNSIFSLVNLYNSTGDENLLNEIDLMTPGNSKKVSQRLPETRVGNYNHQAAINYAIQWYSGANVGATTPYVYYVNGDCTNFVSQCLRAGGKGDTSSWWCNGKYNHSSAWVNANQFVNTFDTYDSLYEGNQRRTGSHFRFTESISAGDVIALDFNGDWIWDHLGIVTDWDNYTGSYGYYDYKVAQHTANYWEWTSSAANGWEDDNGSYYWAKVNVY